MKTKRRFVYLSLLFTLVFSSMGCSNNEENNEVESCVSGTILIEPEESGQYVYIGELKMSPENEKYSYIETIVVPKDESPLQDYRKGDVIDFQILEVKSEFPPIRDAMHSYPFPYPEYLCSIKLCK